MDTIYSRSHKPTGLGLTDIVRQLDLNLDTEINGQITAAIDAINAIPGDFRDAITANKAAV